MYWLLHPILCAWEELYAKRASLTESTTTPGKIAKKGRVDGEGNAGDGDENELGSPPGPPVSRELFQD